MHSRGVSARTNPGANAKVRPVSPGHSDAGVFQGVLASRQGVSPGVLGTGQGVWSGVLPNDIERVSLSSLATEIGVAPTYLRKIVRQTNDEVSAQAAARAAGLPEPGLSATYLHAIKGGKTWFVDRAEADRFAAARKPQQIIHGYDVTFSVQKSVSVLWAALPVGAEYSVGAADQGKRGRR